MGEPQEEGVVSSADNSGGMEREVGSLFLQRALKTERGVSLSKRSQGILEDWGGLSATEELPSSMQVNCWIFPPHSAKTGDH